MKAAKKGSITLSIKELEFKHKGALYAGTTRHYNSIHLIFRVLRVGNYSSSDYCYSNSLLTDFEG